MKAISTAIALLATGALAQLTINTPANVVECQPTLLTWTGGTAPYYLSILPGASPNGTPLESFPAMNSTSYSWTVNIAADTSIDFTLRDSTGTLAQSAPVTVLSGSSDCLTSGSVTATGSSGASTTSGASGASSSAAGTSATTTAAGTSASISSSKAVTTTPSSVVSSASSTATSSGSSGSTGGAPANVARLGAAGLVGAAVAVILL